MNSIGSTSGIGASLSPNQVGGDNFIRYIGDRLILDFHEGAGTTVQDLSGNGNDGTFGAGAAAPTWERNRLRFGGSGSIDWIAISDDLTLGLSVMTLEAHIKEDVHVSDAEFIFKGSTNYYLLGVSANKGILFVLSRDSVDDSIEGGADLSITSPSHCTGIWDGSTMRIYLNGSVQPETQSSSGSVDTSGEDVYLGGGVGFDGTISFVRITATTFSAPQVLQEYLWNRFRT